MPAQETPTSLHEPSTDEVHQPEPRSEHQGKDHWTAHAYSSSASFVPRLADEVVQWLDPQPNDTILDLGCGDGVLTAKIHSSGARVAGFDASSNFIKAAETSHGTDEGLTWNILDCRYLENSSAVKEEEYTKVFSNAALHWILRDASTRMSVFRAVYKTLQSGGTFVFEMGGAGNVADAHTALLAALVHQGVTIEKAREACPWFFPSEQLMKEMLEMVGFRVEKMKLEYRPTKLTTEKEGGLEGWVRLMGAHFLDVLPTDKEKENVVREVCAVLQTVLTHEEDGSMWLGYVRLKAVARK